VGPNLTGQLFDLSNPATPLATASAADSTFTAGGAGLITAAGDAMPTSGINVTFDNLLVQAIVPEPASLAPFALGLAAAGLWASLRRRSGG
jgi:hypothetical protein